MFKSSSFIRININFTNNFVFLLALLSGIRGAAKNNDNVVTVEECEEIYDALNPSLQTLFDDMKTGSYMKTLNKVINDFENLFNK